MQIHRRGGEGGFTVETIRAGAVRLACLGVDLRLAVIYEDVPLSASNDADSGSGG